MWFGRTTRATIGETRIEGTHEYMCIESHAGVLMQRSVSSLTVPQYALEDEQLSLNGTQLLRSLLFVETAKSGL